MLINEYQPGQGIMPHEDGAAYYPIVATVSLGAPIVLDLMEKQCSHERQGEQETRNEEEGSKYRILQERRSLLVTTGSLYTDYLHGIEERTKDDNLGGDTVCNWQLLGDQGAYREGWYHRRTRVSLTYRDVLKVSKLGNSMKFLGGK